MEVIIVGCGKVGAALARILSEDGNSVTLIDTNAEKLRAITDELDIMGISGNGSSIGVLSEAGMETADVFIAVTGSDELNLLCCVFAKKASNCHAIARVRNPIYSRELDYIKKQLGIAEIINPERATAKEISMLLRFPAADQIDSFADDKVQLLKFELDEAKVLSGLSLRDFAAKFGREILVCAVEREGEVNIPSGNFTLQNGDVVTVLATVERAKKFFAKLDLPTRPVKNALIVGCGSIGYYLTKDLLENNIEVRIIDKDPARCEHISEMFPDAVVMCGDGTDRQLLLEAGVENTEAFITLTNMDEENVLTTLFAKKHSQAKTVTKVTRLEFDDILAGLDIGSVVYPKHITCDEILKYVRTLESGKNHLKSLHHILDDRVEALEFTVLSESDVTGVSFSELRLKKNLLICCIIRSGKIIIPSGADEIRVGDNVVVVTTNVGLHDISDILVD